MQTTQTLEQAVRNIQLRLTLGNWETSLKILNDLYGDLGEWDYHEACGWLVRMGKTPAPVFGGEYGKRRYCWRETGTGSSWPEHRVKASFVYRVDRINRMGTTRKLLPQLSGFLHAWKQGGRPEGPDKVPFIRWIVKELTWNNWFSTVQAIARYGNRKYAVESCNWLWQNQKRPIAVSDGFAWYIDASGGKQHMLPVQFATKVWNINRSFSTPKIQPQLLAFMRSWKEGFRPGPGDAPSQLGALVP